ncbi:DUF748 domain-containing protein [Psychromonas sp. Urea-02u-13]|uniref:DUF748 domain-containing protein n=1 Tax=Psychromonas sp. Urea-02u-13 TaxID=2058326 RepID=UPI000C3450A0|nr:DUF748 domain-containing protein [Psychromonas sp. Urea-02u-13]PKG40996.1 hypothetical protein CXF74_00435 [Psychromonas sp. Urea-02u-13]
MNTFKKLFSRQFYRSVPFWLLFLLALYSLIGFVALPKIIHNTISEQVDAQLGWQTSIKKIEVNPFLFTLTISELAITEEQAETIAFSRFHADFELRSLFEGAFTFKNVELIDPSFHLAIAADGTTNIQQALAQHQIAEVEIEPTAATPFVMPKLLFDNISVKNGSLKATDHSQKTLIKHQLNPISFNLKDFSTYVEKGGDYELHISLGNEQSIDWSGNLSVAPISSQGSFSIKGIKAHRLWPYIAPFSPYTLLHSDVDLQSNYALSYIDSHFQVTLDNAFVTLHDINVALQAASPEFVSIKQIKVGPTQFNLNQQNVAIEKIVIDSIDLDLLRDKSGELALLAPLDKFLAKNNHKEQTITETTPAVNPSKPFQWSIKDIVVENSQINFVDQSVKSEAKIKIHEINASLSELNQSLANKQAFSLSYQVESSKKNSISGDLTAQPFKLNSHLVLADIALNLVQPYVSEFANVSIEKGALSVTGDVKLARHKQQGLQDEFKGNFKGNIAITDFDSRDTIIKRRLLGWKKLQVTPFKVNLSPLAIDINKIILDKPYSRLVITADRSINFSQLMIAQKETKSKKTKAKSKQSPAPQININEILINGGSTYFADLSLRPQFGTSIQNMHGVIKGLSSNNLESADVKIKGTVEEYGKVLVEGKINPLSGDLYTDININFDKIELTTLTPYAGRYAGYVIDKGKLSLALNYKIVKGYLDGHNRLILDQFELGDAVDSEESLDLPLKLALALFKDSDGIIDISLPTTGDMNSPDFEIGGLIMKALLNVLTKAVTSPFSLLANLAGGDEQTLNAVEFELASATLSEQQTANLKTLAELLNKRPQLILEIRVNVDSEQESHVLKIQALNTRLALADKAVSEQINIMEQAITETEGEKTLEALKKPLVEAQDPEKEVEQALFDEQYQQLLFDHLVSVQPLASLQLTELAQQRISVIKNELIKINTVNNSQVFALNPSLEGSAENNIITTTFNLTSK